MLFVWVSAQPITPRSVQPCTRTGLLDEHGFHAQMGAGGGTCGGQAGQSCPGGAGGSTGHPGALAVNGVTPGGTVW